MDECIEAIMTLGKLLVPITIAVREEFELPIDETEYRNIIEEAGQDDSQLQQVC